MQKKNVCGRPNREPKSGGNQGMTDLELILHLIDINGSGAVQVQPQAEQSQVVIRLVMYLNEKKNLDWLTNLKTKFSIIHHPPLNLRRIRFMIQITT